ncbi:bifunctional endoribonuclease/protein kinase ire1 [Ceratocystis pirilliformis]|uniref:non-specific serine/threonine protein kinase n=1 Tax=Ceratocystis pirilliformis TaxID=259994 RepID=A0ABR3Z0X7_9PEZI
MQLRLGRYLIAFAVLPVAHTAIVDASPSQQTHHPEKHFQIANQDSNPSSHTNSRSNTNRNVDPNSSNPASAAAAAGYVPQYNQDAERVISRISQSYPSISDSNVRYRRDTAPLNNKKRATDEYQPKFTDYITSDDASALATLAPALAVRAPTPRLRSSPTPGSGVASQHLARSLGDWEVEDFVLMATVDGDLYAADRTTGRERWRLEVELPMVETIHYRANSSITDDDFNPVDHYLWAVEPSQDGSLYLWVPGENSLSGASIVQTGLTMRKLVEELAPYADAEQAVIYVGSKSTTLITLDAATGRVLKWFGESGTHVNEPESCLRPTAPFDREECASTGTIRLGRTEYTVAIQREDGKPVAMLKYREWGPNNFDQDLLQQYHASQTSFDNRYITSRHDGKVYGLDYGFDEATFHEPNTEPGSTVFSRKLPCPVARVFDLCRPRDVEAETNPELVVFPQPAPPAKNLREETARSTSIFLNKTQGGSWFALSGASYPMITNAPVALMAMDGLIEMPKSLEFDALCKALVGTHSLGSVSNGSKPKHHVHLIESGGPPQSKVENEYDYIDYIPPVDVVMKDPPTFIERVKSLPQTAARLVALSIIDLVSNPALFCLLIFALFYYQDDVRRWIRQRVKHGWLQDAGSSRKRIRKFLTPMEERDNPMESLNQEDRTPSATESSMTDRISKEISQVEANQVLDDDEIVDTLSPKVNKTVSLDMPEKNENKENGVSTPPVEPAGNSPNLSDNVVPSADSANAPPPKKKAHRGRRGGVKHKKKKRDSSQSREEDEASKAIDQNTKSVDDAVKGVLKITQQRETQVEPDVHSIMEDPENLNSPRLRMGQLEVDINNQLGTGSNGTLVFAGRFDGRDVAVKRMLIQFYDIASQETRLLRESDDHPNVIRYHSQQVRDGFLYIALERCAASLSDVVEKPHMFRQLADAGRQDIPSVLYQITNGIKHLHSLRIVHRDLKPQNILVNMGNDGKPRLLVSDFGLCKKLEGGQSSFGATTGRAAGTSGWRAPELLLDDDARDIMESSIHSGSGSVLVGDGLTPRRATRSIDIFSLGLVFYYVLTNGAHPFDCGDRYMREVNIRKGKYNLDQLEVLGEFRYEAEDLIKDMLNANPKQRPPAHEVLAHPFFWPPRKRLAFLADVSDHFEKEQRDPPSEALQELERHAPAITKGDFLRALPREFTESLGKQRKYTGSRLLDLLRALRNKKNHYEDMSDSLKRTVGSLPDGYLSFWTVKFPMLLLVCWDVVYCLGWDSTDRFREYYEPGSI